MHPARLRRAIRTALSQARIPRQQSGHALRHPPLKSGEDIRTVLELRGRSDVTPTMIDSHLLNRDAASGIRWTVEGRSRQFGVGGDLG